MSSTHKEREAVFVVLRADLYHAPDTPPEMLVTAKEVVRSQELAECEVARLNAMQPDGQVRYWYTPSRLFPPGRSASSVEESAYWGAAADRVGRGMPCDESVNRFGPSALLKLIHYPTGRRCRCAGRRT